MQPKITLRRALEDPALLGGVLTGPTWDTWKVILLASMGEQLTEAELKLFSEVTGRERAPDKRVDELWAIVGRRGGKSRAMAVLALYLAGFVDYSDHLVRGERGTVLLIAPDMKQAKVSLEYAYGAAQSTPMLSQLIAERRADELVLNNGIVLEVRSSSFRRIRGVTCVAAIMDETAFWKSEDSANVDTEILSALRPALATTHGLLIAVSSPHARRGILWESFRRNFGAEGDPEILVAKGTSRTFNPSLPEKIITRALERDPAGARAEYLAEFRDDLSGLLTQEAISACTDIGVKERPHERQFGYACSCDPSGGSSDSMTLGLAHKEGTTVVLDLVREIKAPFSPEFAVSEFASVIKKYRCSEVTGDRYAAEWTKEAFRNVGITYLPSDYNKSEIYLDLLPLINSRGVGLLDNERLATQLANLERTSVRGGGRDRVDHPRGLHDDLANAAAGAIVLASQGAAYSTKQRLADNLKMETAYKKWARSVA